jgi:hypothetical protein
LELPQVCLTAVKGDTPVGTGHMAGADNGVAARST